MGAPEPQLAISGELDRGATPRCPFGTRAACQWPQPPLIAGVVPSPSEANGSPAMGQPGSTAAGRKLSRRRSHVGSGATGAARRAITRATNRGNLQKVPAARSVPNRNRAHQRSWCYRDSPPLQAGLRVQVPSSPRLRPDKQLRNPGACSEFTFIDINSPTARDIARGANTMSCLPMWRTSIPDKTSRGLIDKLPRDSLRSSCARNGPGQANGTT
jgi:hypothetical protein